MWVALILAVLGAAVSAAGAVQSAQAQKKAAKFNAEVSKKNAQSAAEQAAFDAERIRDKNKRILASQRAAFSASGIDPDSGSAVDVSADSAAQGEMDALMAIYIGKTSANANIARSRLSDMEADNASSAGKLGAMSSLLGGATSAYRATRNPSMS
ncbi:hypothetical protein [Caudoviricetes sp.]|nr:hypothetical protein [Caudoviricetes sp.]